MIPVTLSSAEMGIARDLGMERVARSVEKGRLPRFPYTGSETPAKAHVLGARGEAAFCKALGIEWAMSVDNFADDLLPGAAVVGIDQPPDWQVRTSPNPTRLKVSPNDHADASVAHVSGNPDSPVFRVHGYVLAGWAQAHFPAFDEGDRGQPAHWVPVGRLSPIGPDYHDACRWARYGGLGWRCHVCNASWPEPRGQGGSG